MYLILILLILITGQVIVGAKKGQLSLVHLVRSFFWMEETWQNQILGMLQVGVILLLSVGKTLRAEQGSQRLIVFCLAFIAYSLLLKILITLTLWFTEYLVSITLGITFSILTPTVILLLFSSINTAVTRQVAFVALKYDSTIG